MHDYCKFARDLASDQRLKISDVFPFATTADWALYVSEATRNINTNIATHLTPMVNPQAYRNVDDAQNLTAQVADGARQRSQHHMLLARRPGVTTGLSRQEPEHRNAMRTSHTFTNQS